MKQFKPKTRKGPPPLFYPGDEILVGEGENIPKKYWGLVGQVIGRSSSGRADLPGYTIYFPELDLTREHLNPASFSLVSGPQDITRHPYSKSYIAEQVARELVNETIGRDISLLDRDELEQAYISEIASKFSRKDVGTALKSMSRGEFRRRNTRAEERIASIYGDESYYSFDDIPLGGIYSTPVKDRIRKEEGLSLD